MAAANLGVELFSLAIMLLLILCNRWDKNWARPQSRTMNVLLWANCVLIGSFIGAWLLDGRARYLPLILLLTCVKCGFAFVLAGFYTKYIVQTVPIQRIIPRRMVRIIYGLCCAALVLNIVSVFNGMYFACPGGVYQRGPLLWLNQILAVVILIGDVALVVRCRKALTHHEKVSLISYAILPGAAALLQLAIPPEIDAICIGTTMALLVIYASVHVGRGQKLAERETELLESRTTVMLSQIQPHFLYNSLASIQDMCHGKAPEAEQSLVEFAEFLRGNLDSLTRREPIPFERELAHTRNYLALECYRFGGRLRTEFDLQVTAFCVPALTLQPIVENAVRHGVTEREEGGVVRIASAETADAYVVTVTDDGVGFDPTKELADGRSHIGIANVRGRLEAMCGGALTVQSIPGRGTVTTIKIPKERQQK
ncbi:sensor histidine kinase [Acidaminobacterium chupaoyuni]